MLVMYVVYRNLCKCLLKSWQFVFGYTKYPPKNCKKLRKSGCRLVSYV